MQTPNPGRLRFSNIMETGRREFVARTERKVARNTSSATVTDTEEFTWSVSRTVTVEESRARIHSAGAGLTLAGFGELNTALTTELRKMYAVSTQATLTRVKTVSAEIPPHTAIEFDLTWKVVRQTGVGQFLGEGGIRADVPFEVDVALVLDWAIRDV
ncbi:hypothetical protein ACFVWZ_15505 [Streptomyces sp. NPDC058200]|uniref:hypothetical protein n=1 Tax=Streptomyces sp. NPDC058200 TaxID=3346378 RepID=UPI0036E4F7F9